MDTPSTTYRVHLVDEATVVERGERVRVWFLEENDAWVRAKDHPAALIEEVHADQRDEGCPPGTIWRRSVELVLPPRTPLLCRVTSPLVENLDPIQYLTRERHSMRRHVDETWFEVSGNYRLTKTRQPSRVGHAREAPNDGAEPPRDARDTPRSR